MAATTHPPAPPNTSLRPGQSQKVLRQRLIADSDLAPSTSCISNMPRWTLLLVQGTEFGDEVSIHVSMDHVHVKEQGEEGKGKSVESTPSKGSDESRSLGKTRQRLRFRETRADREAVWKRYLRYPNSSNCRLRQCDILIHFQAHSIQRSSSVNTPASTVFDHQLFHYSAPSRLRVFPLLSILFTASRLLR